jgi:TfoX/Sxy family transcriptional regulator of competence genes
VATRQSIIDYIVEQVAAAGSVYAKKMFGEYGLYCEGKLVALVCDDQLFFKPTTAGKAFLGKCVEKSPYPGAKPCFFIPGEKWDDHEWLARLTKISATELPMPKSKPSRKKAKKP